MVNMRGHHFYFFFWCANLQFAMSLRCVHMHDRDSPLILPPYSRRRLLQMMAEGMMILLLLRSFVSNKEALEGFASSAAPVGHRVIRPFLFLSPRRPLGLGSSCYCHGSFRFLSDFEF